MMHATEIAAAWEAFITATPEASKAPELAAEFDAVRNALADLLETAKAKAPKTTVVVIV